MKLLSLNFYLVLSVLLISLLGFVDRAEGSTINTRPHYNVLPEFIGKQATPNILIVFDNSFSMDNSLSDQSLYPLNGAHPDSRSYIARQVLSDIFDDLVGEVNLGLMVFDASLRELVPPGHPLYDPLKDPEDQVRLREPCSQATREDNWGALMMELQPFDQAAREQIGKFLATEDNVLSIPETIESIHCTPIAGTLYNAYEYLIDESLPEDRNFTGKENIQYPSDLAPDPLSCPVATDIILVTDGVASAKNSTIGCNVYPPLASQENTRCSLRQIEKLFQAGVRTHVIGFDGDFKDYESKSLKRLTAAGNGLTLSEAMAAGNTDYPYLNASNADELKDALSSVLENIYRGSASGSPASISISSNQDVASFVQSVYQPTVVGADDELGNETFVNWAGFLRSMFYDGFGFIREDTNQNDKLDDYGVDRAVRFVTTEDDGTQVERLNIEINGQGVAEVAGVVETVGLNELKPIWEVSEGLSELDQNSITTQRAYASSDPTRYIFTSVDGIAKEFTWNSDPIAGAKQLNPTDIEYLFINDSTDTPLTNNEEYAIAENLINWTRGLEGISGFRNRTLNIAKANGDQDCFDDGANDPDCDEVRFLLGDSIHSGPITVGPPSEIYFEKYGDQSYKEFRESLAGQRRSVVYTGSNDGMIRAVNAGKFDAANRQYNDGGTFELGAEMWAYIPESLLPHLRFWADPQYTSNAHVYGIDGHFTSFDLKVNNDDWRTYLVVTTGYGGFDHQVDTNKDDVLTNSDELLTPSVVILDVTNPDVPPRLVTEIRNPEFGAITSSPVLVKNGNPNGIGEWYLVFGTGPSNIQEHVRDDGEKVKLYMYKLNADDAVLVPGFPKAVPNSENGFLGDIAVADWNNDYADDALYFGTSMGDSETQSGQFFRMSLDDFSMQELLSGSQSFDNQPFLFSDGDEKWIFIGTGRINSRQDFNSGEQNAFYGIRESFINNTLEIDKSVVYGVDKMFDVSGIKVYTDGSIEGENLPLDGNDLTIDTYAGLKAYVQGETLGWYRQAQTSANIPSERIPGPATSPGLDLLTYTTYQPEYACLIGGQSTIHSLSALTGTAPYSKSLDSDVVELIETSNPIEGGVLVRSVQFTRTSSPLIIQPGGDPGEVGCTPGDPSCDPCVVGGPGYPEQCDNKCGQSTTVNTLCVGSDGSNPACEVRINGSCGLGRNSYKEIDFRY